jgi:hypothetical protein
MWLFPFPCHDILAVALCLLSVSMHPYPLVLASLIIFTSPVVSLVTNLRSLALLVTNLRSLALLLIIISGSFHRFRPESYSLCV